MCLTCEDKSSTNPNLCGVALAARAEDAEYIYDKRATEGTPFRILAEERGINKDTARKLYREHADRLIKPEHLADFSAQVEQLEEAIYLALSAVSDTTDIGEKMKALATYNSLVITRAKLLNMFPQKQGRKTRAGNDITDEVQDRLNKIQEDFREDFGTDR